MEKENDEYELLVHVSAPARVVDDKRYLSIAQGITDFEGVTRLEVGVVEFYADGGGNGDVDAGSGEKSMANKKGKKLKKHQRVSEKLSSLGEARRHKKQVMEPKAAASPANWPRRKPGSDTLSVERRSLLNNPPYKSPIHGLTSKPIPNEPRTPHEGMRPRTAPEQLGSTVQVPFTGVNKRRANSESQSFNSLSSVILDSQKTKTRSLSASQDKRKLLAERSVVEDSMISKKSGTRSLSQVSLEDEPRVKRVKRSSGLEEQPKSVRQARSEGMEAYFPRNCELDWTSSPTSTGESKTNSVASTASLTQSLSGFHQQAGSPDLQTTQVSPMQRDDPTSTSPDAVNTNPQVLKQAQQGSSDSFSSDKSPLRSKSSTKMTPKLVDIELPVEVRSPDPPCGQSKFTSHVTDDLAYQADRLSFERFFRPFEVTRDVKVLERGYWQLDITVADQETVYEARRLSTKEQKRQASNDRFTGTDHKERRRNYQTADQVGNLHSFDYGFEDKAVRLLTEEEVLTFWRNLSSFLVAGKAGWGVRMVCEELPMGSVEGTAMRLRIRIFAWAEILGHLYLAMWVLSDKATAWIPMVWVAGDGSTIVKMAGTWADTGSLGVWTRKGSQGENGAWGIAES